jgi:hypothetical protein
LSITATANTGTLSKVGKFPKLSTWNTPDGKPVCTSKFAIVLVSTKYCYRQAP